MGKIIGTFFVWLWEFIKWWGGLHIAFFKLVGLWSGEDGGGWEILWFILAIPILIGECMLFGMFIVYLRRKIRDFIGSLKMQYCRCGVALGRSPGRNQCDDCAEKYKNNYLAEMREKFQERLELAERYETAGRYEEAAQIYDEFAKGAFDGYFKAAPEYLEEAGRVRKLSKTQYVKTTKLDINQLISQLKEVVNYKCPNCGAGIDIHSKTSVDGLKFCSHCGLALNSSGITKFLLKVL